MLWTDSVFISQTDLGRLDSEVDSVAEAVEIQLDGVDGVIRGAIDEAGLELQKRLIAFGGGIMGTGDVSANHAAAVANIGYNSSISHKALLSQVVVSGMTDNSWSWIKSWAVIYCLRFFYRDCFNRAVTDRYEGKMRYWNSELTKKMNNYIFSFGVPIVISPLSSPGAFFEPDAGTFDVSNVTSVAGGGTVIGDRIVAVTYVDMSRADRYVDSSNRGNAESAPSDHITVALTTGHVINVDITSLVPPTGILHPSLALLCTVMPMTATHWNVYVGTSATSLKLQNSDPIPITTKQHTLAGDPDTLSAKAGLGQYFNRVLVINQNRQRA